MKTAGGTQTPNMLLLSAGLFEVDRKILGDVAGYLKAFLVDPCCCISSRMLSLMRLQNTAATKHARESRLNKILLRGRLPTAKSAPGTSENKHTPIQQHEARGHWYHQEDPLDLLSSRYRQQYGCDPWGSSM